MILGIIWIWEMIRNMTIEEEIDFCLSIGKDINWTDEMVIDRVLLNRFILRNSMDILFDRVYTHYPEGYYSEKFVIDGWHNPYMSDDCNCNCDYHCHCNCEVGPIGDVSYNRIIIDHNYYFWKTDTK